MKKEKPFCPTCGSDKILFDAYAEWDVETQTHVLLNAFDDTKCADCGSEFSPEWKEITS